MFRSFTFWTVVALIGSVIAIGWAIYWVYNSSESLLNKVGFLGSIASICGIVIAFLQTIEARTVAAAANATSKQAKTAADAAKEASENTARQLRNSHYKYNLLTARRILYEVKVHLDNRVWSLAAIRVGDLVSHAGQLVHLRSTPDREWVYVRQALPTYISHFKNGTLHQPLVFDEVGWDKLYYYIDDKINRECDPLEDRGNESC